MIEYAWLIPVFPLVGMTINGLFGIKYIKNKAHWVAVPALGLSWLFAILVFIDVLQGKTALIELFDWIVTPDVNIKVAFWVDQLTAVMLMVVTTLSFWIHVYSIGYMGHDPGYPRYFTYLNMFVFFMLILVLGSSYLLLFVGWEGVGLCSYLLIGYWYERESAWKAGMKAFITNRVGDYGFILGMFTLWYYLGTLNFNEVFAKAHTLSPEIVTIATLLLFVGATGKSAQIPLYVWLPDAMEGPTPVSALIHAATMVTAGVYMVARSNVLYNMAPLSLEVVAIIGCLTAFFAATMGTSQFDLKRVMAYSTVSQLGYMFFGCGVGAYASGIFHLMTHAFFKGLLFLSSGSVMHAMSDVLDMRLMGNLKKYMPITSITFIIGGLALAGIPPFAGFWSKDEILHHAFTSGHTTLWFLGTLTAGITAYYTFRAIFMTFFGNDRIPKVIKKHLHESPPVMTIPLIVLSVGAIFAGFFGLKRGEMSYFGEFLAPVIHAAHHGAGEHAEAIPESVLIGLSVLVGLTGIFIAYLVHMKRLIDPNEWVKRLWFLHRVFYRKYWVDELYFALFINRTLDLAFFSWKFDQWIIDGVVNGASWLSRALAWVTRYCTEPFIVDGAVNGASYVVDVSARIFRRLQTGLVSNYMLFLIAGTVGLLTFYVFIKLF